MSTVDTDGAARHDTKAGPLTARQYGGIIGRLQWARAWLIRGEATVPAPVRGLIETDVETLFGEVARVAAERDSARALQAQSGQPSPVDADLPNPPRVVWVCGCRRFADAFRAADVRLTLAGHIVLSIGVDLRTDTSIPTDPAVRDAIKARLDALHRRKIDLADEVHVLNVDGYIGESTAAEIAYATELGKPISYLVSYLVPPPDGGDAG